MIGTKHSLGSEIQHGSYDIAGGLSNYFTPLRLLRDMVQHSCVWLLDHGFNKTSGNLVKPWDVDRVVTG